MIQKDDREQKVIIGVGLALFLLSGASIFSIWNLIGGVSIFSSLNPMLIVATLTSSSWALINGVFILILRSKSEIAYNQAEAESALQRTNEELENRVAERTAALKQANDELVTEIVERRRVELALRKSAAELARSEERFRTCIENMLDCFGIYQAIRDESGEIVDFAIEYVNAAACVNNQMTKEEQIGQRLCELMPNHCSELFEEYCQLVKTGQPLLKESFYYEDIYKGQTINRVFNLCAVKLGDGFACAWRDVTERIQAEEARRKTEELYRTLTKNFPNGAVMLFDNDLRYTLAEGKGLADVSLSKEKLKGKTIWELFSPETCELLEPYYRAALDGNTSILEVPYTDRTYLLYALPVKNEQGEILAGMVMTQDITERKRAEIALIEERNFISAILDTANALIIVLDEQGRIVRFNRACEQITGYSFDEVKRQYFWDFLLLSEEVESVKAVFGNLLLGQYPNEHENYWVAKDGSRRRLSWSNTVLRDTDGSVKYIIGIGIDITDRKQAEEMRRVLEREQELHELRYRFFAMASHEFRTPLSTILLTAQLLNSSVQEGSPEKSKRNLQRIESAAKTMKQMLDDILTINRAETGKLEFNPIPVDVEQLCRYLLEEMKRCASPGHLLSFMSEISEQLVCVDEKIIHNIITHLLSNAIKYSPEGGEIDLVLSGVGQEIQVQVRDRGIGIPLADQSHLFEAFHRGENTDRISGSGLGLTVVKKCVELHGGSITFTSEVGAGTTFTVTIPGCC